MPFGHSALVGMFAGNLAKRLTLLTAGAFGLGRRETELLSDEIGIVAAQTIGTATAVVTLDPVGAVILTGYAGLLENEMARKIEIGGPAGPFKPAKES